MVNITAAFANLTRPGTFVRENTAGFRVQQISSHNTIYMIGSGTAGEYLEPTLVRNLEDFQNQFGGSPSEASVKLLFRNNRQAVCYFVRCDIGKRFTITIDTATQGDYTLTVNGTEVTYTAGAGDDEEAIAEALIDAINNSAAGAKVSAFDPGVSDQLRIRPDGSGNQLTVTVDEGSATLTDTTPTSPQAADYVDAIENTFDYEEDWAQGFILCPEAFQNLSNPTDRLAVGAAMEALASEENFDWVALVDTGADLTTIAQVREEGERYATPQGHTSFYAPYLKDLEGDIVPASAAVVGIATKRYSEQGYHQPMAGAKYPVQGVVDVATRFGNQDQSVLNPLGINLVRYLRNKGVVVWGMRSRSSNSFYRFTHTRVIMNVLNGTLRSAFDLDLFTSIDGQGVLLTRIQNTAVSICRRMWIGGALFGNTSADAFEVRCDFENNTADNLELGQVLLEVFVAPAPAMEKLLIASYRTTIGRIQESAAAGQVISE